MDYFLDKEPIFLEELSFLPFRHSGMSVWFYSWGQLQEVLKTLQLFVFWFWSFVDSFFLSVVNFFLVPLPDFLKRRSAYITLLCMVWAKNNQLLCQRLILSSFHLSPPEEVFIINTCPECHFSIYTFSTPLFNFAPKRQAEMIKNDTRENERFELAETKGHFYYNLKWKRWWLRQSCNIFPLFCWHYRFGKYTEFVSTMGWNS